jgi:hypothetical protein
MSQLNMADLGIAKILAENMDGTQTKTLGTIGYIAWMEHKPKLVG